MDQPTSPLTDLGARLRAARRERGMSQEQLAQPEFTKSYISAVERGKARPSLKALHLLAGRLGIPMNELLGAPLDTATPDLSTSAADLDHELNRVAALLYQQQALAALAHLAGLETAYQDTLPQLDWALAYRLHLLRAEVQLRMGQAGAARDAGQTALALAEDHGDTEAAIAARDLLGAAFLQEGLPIPALDQHEQCWRAITRGQVHDPHLALRIAQHLIADYQALHQPESAEGVAQEAKDLLNATATLAGLAARYTAGVQAVEEVDPARARRYLAQAVSSLTVADTLNIAAGIQIEQAAGLLDLRKYDEASALLSQADQRLALTGHPHLPLHLAAQRARLEIARGNPEGAAELTQVSIQAAEQALKAPARVDGPAQVAVRTAFVRLLALAGTIAEQQGHAQQADAAFTQAIGLLDPSLGPLVAEIEAQYADLLAERGDHAGANRHYQAATRYTRQR